MKSQEVIVMAGNGKAAILKEYGNLGLGFVVAAMLAFVLWSGRELAEQFLKGQNEMFRKMVDNQRIELEQDKAHHAQLSDHNEHIRQLLERQAEKGC